MKRNEIRVIIVGGGRACYELLTMVQADPKQLDFSVIGVADPDLHSPGIRLAQDLGIPHIVTDFHELLEGGGFDLVVELTGKRGIRDEIGRLLPPGTHFVDHYTSRFFWDLFALAEESNNLRFEHEQRLLDERNRLKYVLDSLPYEILVIGKEFDVQMANRTFLEASGLNLEDIVGKPCYEIEHRTKAPCDVGVDGCPYWETLKEGHPVATVVTHRDEHGEEQFAAVRAAPIRDDEGEILGVVETIRDITARITVEEKLKETRERLNQFIDTAPLFIYMKDVNLRYRVMNRKALEMLELEEDDIAGKTDFEIFPESVARRNQVLERKVLQTGRTVRAVGVLPVHGSDKHINITLFPVKREDEVIGLFGLIEDTTELHESELQLERKNELLSEAQEHLQRVLENSRDLIFFIDPAGVLRSFNSGAQKALGYSESEVVGRPISELCQGSDTCHQLIETALGEGHALQHEVKLRRKNGEECICSVSLTTIEGADGKPSEIIGLCRDITGRLRLQNDLIRADRLAAVGKMAAGVAHEINNPLAVIDTIAGVIGDVVEEEGDALSEPTRELLGKVVGKLRAQVKRCSNITHSLLGFVRRTSSGRVHVDVVDLLEETLNLVGSEIHVSGVELQRDYQPDLPTVLTDPLQLQQVLVNLLKNAVDAIEEKPDIQGILKVRAAAGEEGLMIEIEDNGVGIPRDSLTQIFDLFHTSKPVGKGSGLGLTIVHDIMQKLGGHVRVASEEGSWTRFTLILPLEAEQADSSMSDGGAQKGPGS